MECPKCGAGNPDYAVYCGSCSALIKEPKKPRFRGERRRKGSRVVIEDTTTAVRRVIATDSIVVDLNVHDRHVAGAVPQPTTFGCGNVIVDRPTSDVDIASAGDVQATAVTRIGRRSVADVDASTVVVERDVRQNHAESGAQMRESFFKALRAREEEAHKSKLIIDMRGYMTDQGEHKFEIPDGLPPKIQR